MSHFILAHGTNDVSENIMGISMQLSLKNTRVYTNLENQEIAGNFKSGKTREISGNL
jgi:hypothetical protein